MMKRKVSLFVLFAIFIVFESYAQDRLMESVRSGLDTVVKGIHQIGSYADEVLRTNLFGSQQSMPYTTEQKYENRFPVSQNIKFFITNEFGMVEIKSWNEPIIHITTTLTVGGEKQESVNQVVNEYQLKITNENDIVSMENKFPETKVSYLRIDHLITLPRSAFVLVNNFFGDSRITGVDGDVIVNAQYGAIELENINGNVSVRMEGEFPIKVRRITNGGMFYLSRAVAEFSDVAGEVGIYSLLGSTKIQKLGLGRFVFHSDNSKIYLQIDDTQNTDIKGSLLSSKFNTDLSIMQKTTGALNVLSLQNSEAKQKIEITSTFSEIVVVKSDSSLSNLSTEISNAKPYSETDSWEENVKEGDVLIVNNQKGDIRILSSDEPQVKVRATKLVWVSSADRATSTLEKVSANFHRTDNRIYVTTGGNFDTDTDKSFNWRVDIQIFCPPGMEVTVESNEGQTACENLEGTLRITQTSGVIMLTKCKGPYFLSNQKGSIRVESVEGNGEVTVRSGTAYLKNIIAPINITAFQSRINLEDIHSRVFARIQEGDMHFLAMNGIDGDIDILAEKGNISVLLPPEVDCKIKAISQGGVIDSAIPLKGFISRAKQELEGQIREGKHNILLQTVNGNIVIDGNIVEPAPVNVDASVLEKSQDIGQDQ